MATPPTRVLSAVPSSGNYTTSGASKVTGSFNVTAGDLLVVVASSEQAGTNSNVTPSASGGSVTWTLRASRTAGGANQSGAWLWTGAVGATATGITVTVPRPNTGTTLWWGCSASVWRAHAGVGQVIQLDSGTSSSIAQGTTPSLAANSAVQIGISDWNAVNVASRTYQTINGSQMTESLYTQGASHATAYGAYRTDVGNAGTETVGLTTPATLRWAMVGVEILGVTASAPQGGATGAISWVGVATGKRVTQGGSTGGITHVGVATGKRTLQGGSTGSIARVGTATGKKNSVAGSTGSITRVGVATGKRNPQAGSTGSIIHTSTATGKKNPLGGASSIIGWMSAATGKLQPKAAATSSISWIGFAIGQKVMGGSSSGSMTRVSSPATGVKSPKGLVAGSISRVAVATGKKEPEGSATGVFTHVGLATGSTPGEAQQGAAIGSVVWTGVASGIKLMKGAAAGSVGRVGTASGKRELTGNAAGAIARVGIATGSQPGVLPALGSATGFLDRIGSASGKLSPVGLGVGSIGKEGVATGKSIPLGSAVGSTQRVGLATGTMGGFYHLTVLSVTEQNTHRTGVSEMPNYQIIVEDIPTTLKVEQITQEITVEEVE